MSRLLLPPSSLVATPIFRMTLARFVTSFCLTESGVPEQANWLESAWQVHKKPVRFQRNNTQYDLAEWQILRHQSMGFGNLTTSIVHGFFLWLSRDLRLYFELVIWRTGKLDCFDFRYFGLQFQDFKVQESDYRGSFLRNVCTEAKLDSPVLERDLTRPRPNVGMNGEKQRTYGRDRQLCLSINAMYRMSLPISQISSGLERIWQPTLSAQLHDSIMVNWSLSLAS